MLVTRQNHAIIFILISLSLCVNSTLSACGKGRHKNENGNCDTCPAGTFNDSDDSESCLACPPGTWTWFYSSDNRISCSGCGKGKFITENKQCSSCPQGTYNDQITGDSCRSCPSGTWNWFYGADNRVGCSGCGKGRFMLGNKICSDCPPGEYSNQDKATSCTKVPPGFKYTNIQSEPTKCGQGFYSAGGYGNCLSCPQNNCSGVEITDKTKKDIYKLAKLSKYAYDKEYDADKSKLQLEEMEVINNSRLETRVISGFDKSMNSIVVSYRGTDNLENGISDLKFFKDTFTEIPNCLGCKVHSGFKEGYEVMDSELQKNLDKLIKSHPNANVIVTGHSYGAALASLKAVNLESKGIQVSLITFGSPRVGNKEFSEFANEKISGMNLRISFQDDPVISSPPTGFGYKHLGNEIQFYNNEEFYVFPKFFDRENNLDSTSLNYHSSYWKIGEGTGDSVKEESLIYLID